MKFAIGVVLALVVASDAFLDLLVPETPQDLLLPVSLRSLQWYKRLRQKSPRKQFPVRRTKTTKIFKRQDLQRLAQQQQQPPVVPLEERMPTVIEQPVKVESDSGCLLRTIIINGIVVKRRECFGRDGRIKMDLLEIDTLGQSKGAQQMLRLGVSRPLSMMEAVEIHALLKDLAPGLSPQDIQSGFNGPPANFPTKIVKVLLDFLKMQVQRMRGGGPGTRPLQPGPGVLASNPGRDGTQSIGQPNVPGQQDRGQMPRDMTPSPTPSPRTSEPTEPATPSSSPPTTTEMTNRGPPDTPPPSEDIGNAPDFPPNFGLASQPSLGAFPTAMLQIFQSLSLILFGAVGISLSLVAPNIFNEIFKFNDFVLYNVNGTLNVAQDVIKANLPTTVGTTTTSTTTTAGGEEGPPTVTSPGPITVIIPIGQDVLTPITRDGTTETSNLRDNRTKSRPLMDRLIKLLFWKQK